MSATLTLRNEETSILARPHVIDGLLVLLLICVTRTSVMPDLNFPAWLVADAVAFTILMRRPDVVMATINRNKLLFTLPLLALLSSVWSLTPFSTAYHALQFVLLIFVAMAFFPGWPLKRLLIIVFFYNFILQFASLYVYLVGGFWPEGFPGAYLHKNLLGMNSTLQIITGGVLFLSGWRRWLSAFSVALAFVLLALSASGTSLVLTAAVIALFPTARILQSGQTATAIALGFGVALLSGLAMALMTNVQVDFINSVLGILGKDSTLTGRSILWDFGMLAIPEAPFLGMGFLAYWDSPVTTASMLQFTMQQDLRMFHNVYLEVAVACGLIGLALFVLTMLQQIIRAALYTTRHWNWIACWPLIFLVWAAMLSMTENPIFGVLPLQFILAAGAVASFADGSRLAKAHD
ncbi:MAG: O-antigen polymerase [Hyphomicrobiales bacterium]|nr:O-antigen polymerase [Hyphomicrobiales bacterium]